MEMWRHIPRERLAREGFTSVELPTADVKAQLESLPAAPSLSPLPNVVLTLRQRLSAVTTVNGAAAIGVTLRRDQKELTNDDQNAFKNAVRRLVSDGTYRALVLIHADMSHNMHGSMGPTGLLRFLGWHRRYIIEFEKALMSADRQLRPTATNLTSLPFWHWADPFPQWLDNFLPSPRPDNNSPPSARRERPPPSKPTGSDISYILNDFAAQLPNVVGVAVNDYVRFTYGLEGWGKRADGSSLPAHNQVHDWVGGIMSNTSYSPTDPVFWLHHAEVDRLWHLWQLQQPNIDPALTGPDRIMDPWTEDYSAIRAIEALNYSYGPVAP
jgi:tyrosinase